MNICTCSGTMMKRTGDVFYCVDCGLEVDQAYEIETVDKWCPECGGTGMGWDDLSECDYCDGEGYVWW